MDDARLYATTQPAGLPSGDELFLRLMSASRRDDEVLRERLRRTSGEFEVARSTPPSAD